MAERLSPPAATHTYMSIGAAELFSSRDATVARRPPGNSFGPKFSPEFFPMNENGTVARKMCPKVRHSGAWGEAEKLPGPWNTAFISCNEPGETVP